MRVNRPFEPKLRFFDHAAPTTLAEAVALHGGRAEHEYSAGATALLSSRYVRKLQPELLISLRGIDGLAGVTARDGQVDVGALTTMTQVSRDPVIAARVPALARAAAGVGSHQVRNRATIGGNVCNGLGVADMVAPLIALEARAVYSAGDAEVTIPAASLWREFNDTAAPRVHVLTRLEVPDRPRWTFAFTKFTLRRALEVGMVNVAVGLERATDGTVSDARVAIAGAAYRPLAARAVESQLIGANGDLADRARAAGRAAVDLIDEPVDDFRATADYRLRVLPTLVVRTALAAADESVSPDPGAEA